jgi:DNA-binding IclR family transcriptional regulator
MEQRHPVKSLRTTFDIIEKLTHAGGAGVSEIATELDIPKSTVHDHLKTLDDLGYVVREDDRYLPSTRFLEIGQSVRSSMPLFEVARDEVRKLAQVTNEHAGLMVEEDDLGVLLYATKNKDADPLPMATFGGIRMPLHANAPGKAILAHLPEERVDGIIDNQGLSAITERTITTRETLEAELEEIREQGYAISRGERIEGMTAVAVPIIDQTDTVQGALTVYGPIGRISDKRLEEEITSKMKRRANVVEVNLNYS